MTGVALAMVALVERKKKGKLSVAALYHLDIFQVVTTYFMAQLIAVVKDKHMARIRVG
jgi:hypothetical protein